jgi:hypothetical protein
MKEAARVNMGGLLLSSRDTRKHLEKRLIAIVPLTDAHPEARNVFQPL